MLYTEDVVTYIQYNIPGNFELACQDLSLWPGHSSRSFLTLVPTSAPFGKLGKLSEANDEVSERKRMNNCFHQFN